MLGVWFVRILTDHFWRYYKTGLIEKLWLEDAGV